MHKSKIFGVAGVDKDANGTLWRNLHGRRLPCGLQNDHIFIRDVRLKKGCERIAYTYTLHQTDTVPLIMRDIVSPWYYMWDGRAWLGREYDIIDLGSQKNAKGGNEKQRDGSRGRRSTVAHPSNGVQNTTGVQQTPAGTDAVEEVPVEDDEMKE